MGYYSPVAFKAAYYQRTTKLPETPPTRRDFYRIWLILEKGQLSFDTGTIQLQQPTLIILPPSVTYTFKPASAKGHGYSCYITKTLVSDIFRTAPVLLYPDATALTTIRFLFEQLVQAYHADHAFRTESCQELISLLQSAGAKLHPVQTQHAAARLTRRCINLLERQYPILDPHQSIALKAPADLARELGVHVNHLNAVIKQTTGKTTRELITAHLLRESRSLLLHTDWTVNEIAACLGFDYPNHFTSFFRKHMGKNPLAFRS